MNKILFIILTFVLIGCSSDGDSSATKSIFSIWTRDDQSFSFNIKDQAFNTPFSLGFLLSTGEICLCTGSINGDELTGSIPVTSCTYSSGGSGDPGCAAIWENGGSPYTYTKSGNNLILCDAPSSCGTYY